MPVAPPSERSRLASRSATPAADAPPSRPRARFAAGWTTPAWMRGETGRWMACNRPARLLHARKTSSVDSALRDADVIIGRSQQVGPSVIEHADGETRVQFLLLPLHDAAGRPAGVLVTAQPTSETGR